MRSYCILGAGAVGSCLGAYLARRGHPIRLVGRPAHVEAIRSRGGLAVAGYDESFLAGVEASAEPPDHLAPDTVLFLTVQSPDVAPALADLPAPAADLPLVTWQNGIRAEETALDAGFRKVYGGVVRFTSTLIDPGEVRLRRPGQLILGNHPEGTDALCLEIVGDLKAAGFTAAASPEIPVEKALKLLVNLVSGPAALLRRRGPSPELAAVQLGLLEEAERVFRAAGVRAEPLSGLGLSLDEMMAGFRAGGGAPDGRPVYNSTWQNLHHRRPRLENRFYHGEIISLGNDLGIPTPINARVLAVLEDALERGLGPEPYDAAAFRDRFGDLITVPEPTVPGLDPPAKPFDV